MWRGTKHRRSRTAGNRADPLHEEVSDQRPPPAPGPAPPGPGELRTVQLRVLQMVERWQLGEIGLPAADIALLDLPGAPQGQGLQGLLRSDVLSGFDYVVVDYDDQRLGFPPA